MSRLAEPITLGSHTLANRFVMTPHVGRLPTKRFLRYLQERVAGGVGMVILPVGHATFMHRMYPDWIDGGPQDEFDFDMLPPDQSTPEGAAYFDKFTPLYQAQANIVHAAKGIFIGQIHHPGPEQTWDGFQPAVAASPVRGRNVAQIPHALTPEEIAHLVRNYALTATRVRGAGADGIEIHAAHGYLLNQFLSPVTNQRSDAYGGTLENRLRLLREILQAVRAVIGGDALLGVRLPAGEPFPGGLSVADIATVINTLAPLLDYVSVSVGTRFGTLTPGNAPAYTAPWFIEQPPAVAAARQIRASISLPLLVTGRITSAALARDILDSGAADLIGLARQLIADPQFVDKALRGATVNTCIACNECTLLPFSCPVNPAAGREAEAQLRRQPAPAPRRVVVVGAGPAGIEAAVAASQRGHEVVLLEQNAEPGGVLRAILNDPQRAAWRPLLERLLRDLVASPVSVRCGQRADRAMIEALAPEVVLVATGAGATLPFASDGSVAALNSLQLWRDALPAAPLRKVVVAAGQDRQLEPLLAALHLAGRAREVLLVTEDLAAGLDLERRSLNTLARRLREAGVVVRTLTALRAIDRGRVQLQDLATGELEALADVDLVVAAHGRVAADELVAQLAPAVKTYAIGDALAPRRFTHAILEGARFGASLI